MKTILNINIDKKLKEEFKEFAEEIGTNPTNLLNMMIKDIVKTRSVTFWKTSILDGKKRDNWIVKDKDWCKTFSKISWEEKSSFILW